MMNRTVSVVLGGSMGMGLECARELGKRSTLVIFARHEEGLKAASEKLKAQDIHANILSGDVSKEEDVKRLAQYANSFGDVKYVVNAAGINGTSDGATLRSVIEIDAVGTINVVQEFYPIMVANGVMVLFASEGRFTLPYADNDGQREIFNQWRNREKFIDALLSIVPNGDYQTDLAYCVAKEFVAWFTKVNVVRFGNRGCRIVSVSPGMFSTRMAKQMEIYQKEILESNKAGTPVDHRPGKPYEMANLVDFLCSDKSSFISGTDILADGGFVAATMKTYLHEDQLTN